MSSSNAAGVQVRGDRDRAFLVGGVDEAVEAFGGVGGDGEQPLRAELRREQVEIDLPPTTRPGSAKP
jgi:hypothetical protein